MRIMLKTRLLPLFALMLVMGAFLSAGTAAAYAAEGSTEEQTLSVDDISLADGLLYITVTDMDSGESRTLELDLSDYAQSGDEFVTIQATDSSGRKSNAIVFKNPYYAPSAEPAQPSGDEADQDSGEGETIVSDDANPFTPGGTGTVVDNATDGDGKEFFTVETPVGNVFYLIIDRQRSAENVYLLNTVTEQDLMALTEESGGAVKAFPSEPIAPTEPEQQPDEPATPEMPVEKGGGNTSLIFVAIAVAAAGGVGYYIKIVRPKRNGGYDDYEDEQEDFDDDTEMSLENDDEEDDDE